MIAQMMTDALACLFGLATADEVERLRLRLVLAERRIRESDFSEHFSCESDFLAIESESSSRETSTTTNTKEL